MKEQIRIENDLGTILAKCGTSVKDKKNLLITVAVVILGFVLGTVYGIEAQLNAKKKVWDEYTKISTEKYEKTEDRAAALKEFAAKYPKSLAAIQVSYELALQDVQLANQKLVEKDTAAAKELLVNAQTMLKNLAADASRPNVGQMANFALGKASEIMAKIEKPEENLKAAQGYYGVVAMQNDAYGKMAQEILASFKREEVNIVALCVAPEPAVTPEEAAKSQDENLTLDAPAPEAVAVPDATPAPEATPAVESAPAAEAAPAPEATPAPEAAPAVESAPAAEAAPAPEATPAPEAAPAVESAPAAEAAPAPEAAPAVESAPAAEAAPAPEAAPAVEAAPTAEAAPAPEAAPAQ